MTNKKMMTNVANKFGYEHPLTIEFCELCENAPEAKGLISMCYASAMEYNPMDEKN